MTTIRCKAILENIITGHHRCPVKVLQHHSSMVLIGSRGVLNLAFIIMRRPRQGSRAILGSQNPDFFLTIFELFPDLKIDKFLARNWVLLETRPYIVTSLFPNKASEAFFPDKDSSYSFIVQQVTDHANCGSKKSECSAEKLCQIL